VLGKAKAKEEEGEKEKTLNPFGLNACSIEKEIARPMIS
jgi:hypothetical protein